MRVRREKVGVTVDFDEWESGSKVGLLIAR